MWYLDYGTIIATREAATYLLWTTDLRFRPRLWFVPEYQAVTLPFLCSGGYQEAEITLLGSPLWGSDDFFKQCVFSTLGYG